MIEPDPKEKAALKDARLLSWLSLVFLLLGVGSILSQTNFTTGRATEYEPAQVMAVMAFTAALVLGIWAFIRLLNGPNPIPSGFQTLIGFIYGNSLWILIGFQVSGHERATGVTICLLLVSIGALLSKNAVGRVLLAGWVMGFFMPILAAGVCGLML